MKFLQLFRGVSRKMRFVVQFDFENVKVTQLSVQFDVKVTYTLSSLSNGGHY